MRKLMFSNHVNDVFTNIGSNYDEVKNLMSDIVFHREMLDEDGKRISFQAAEDKLREINMKFFGLEKGFTKRDFDRAMRDHKRDWFDVVEEIVDERMDVGIRENEVFNQLVNVRNLRLGQDNLFVVEDEDLILSIAKVGVSHHDYILQRPAYQETYTVPVARYGAAVGIDLNRYLNGFETFENLIAALSRSFILKQQVEIYNLIINAATKLPVTTGFIGSGKLGTATKDAFLGIGDNVSSANGGAPIVYVGTKAALRKITDIADVDWAIPAQKEDIATLGRLGSFEGGELFEVPQRFSDRTLTTKLFDDTKIFMFAKGIDNKLVDFVTSGETEIEEITQKGEVNSARYDDLGKYEIQMSWGAAVRVHKQFGQWTLTNS